MLCNQETIFDSRPLTRLQGGGRVQSLELQALLHRLGPNPYLPLASCAVLSNLLK